MNSYDDDAYQSGDTCQTCDMPVEECGHRRPETPDLSDHYCSPCQLEFTSISELMDHLLWHQRIPSLSDAMQSNRRK